MKASWEKYDLDSLDEAKKCNHCLYVFYHPKDEGRPFYIGKAKYFGTDQEEGYKGSARYNSGYINLIAGMLREGFILYIAMIGEEEFSNVELYEAELIDKWNPIRNQKRSPNRLPVNTEMPWES